MRKTARFAAQRRFAWGFEDGRQEASRHQHRDVSDHHDPVHASGYIAGQRSFRRMRGAADTVKEAWQQYKSASQ
jgi:hypothetical protein